MAVPLRSVSTAACPLSETLASHPLMWRGKQMSHHIRTLSTGHACLDDLLPGNGWPAGALTELIHASPGCGEFSLLLPVLAQLSRENHWLVMIDPPWIPYPPALHGFGLALEKLVLVHTQNNKESLWACEQVVRGMPGGAMLAWPDRLSFSELRRLQLAAKNTGKMVFLFRGQKTANCPSPAALRLQLTADEGDLRVRVLKCRGLRQEKDVRLRNLTPASPYFTQPLIPPRVSSSGSSKRSRSSSESPVVSRATSRIGRPSL